MPPHSPSQVLVAIFGNAMAGDDAIGPLIARRLAELGDSTLQVIDAVSEPLSLLDHLPSTLTTLILVDAVTGPDIRPGQVVDMDWSDEARAKLVTSPMLSSHGLSLPQQMDLAGQLGLLPPRVRLIGIGMEDAVLGESLAPAVAAAVEPAVGRILAWAGNRGAVPSLPRRKSSI
jgi:hydrogenase maturation protease